MSHRLERFYVSESAVVPWVLSLSVIYFFILGYITSPVIIHDSATYLKLAEVIRSGPWNHYFLSGPNREPLYPLFLATILTLAERIGWLWTDLLKTVQLGFLFFSQLLTWRLLQGWKIRSGLQGLILFILGFSPALTTAALSVYSEILTLPLMISLILVLDRLLMAKISSPKISSLLVIGTGILLALLTFLRGVFELLSFVLLGEFFALHLFLRWPVRRAASRTAIALIVFLVPLLGYKALNAWGNGHFVLTTRGAWAFYGNSLRRSFRPTGKDVLAAGLHVVDENLCRKVLTPSRCERFSYRVSDELGINRRRELLSQGRTLEETHRLLIQESLAALKAHPLAAAIFYLVESLKLFFWESTQLGFVVFPAFLEKIFASNVIRWGWRCLIGMLTLGVWSAALGKGLFALWHSRKKSPSEDTIRLLILQGLICPYIAVHAFFYIQTRYALPLVIPYLLLMALLFAPRPRDTVRQ